MGRYLQSRSGLEVMSRRLLNRCDHVMKRMIM